MDRAWFLGFPARSTRLTGPTGAPRERPKTESIARGPATAEMADEEGPCEWEGELDDGFPTGQVSFFARSTVHADHAREPRRAPSSCTNDA